jgi:hypothetical protein
LYQSLPTGWDFGGAGVEDGLARFWLNAEDVGERAVTVTLTHDCPLDGEEVRGEGGASQRLDVALTLQPSSQSRSYRFDGRCAIFAHSLPSGAVTLVSEAHALAFMPRDAIVLSVAREEHLAVCGAGAPCPG